MKLESRKITVSKSSENLYTTLEQLESYEGLMPESIEKFEIDNDSFIFGLKGMPEIRLVLKEKTPFNKIVLGAASSKMPFTLEVSITETGTDVSEVQMFFNGEFNPMISMMVKKPLTKFMETLIDNIEKL
ncbi:SRPBCC family protein [Flavicella sp.]|uniref:SRPBCC family protein n=1 Tax=Flavicella sp. TaxID=2957742 RepID=UPI00260ABD32|nr:SRPBCC family protein [Flavicella sp.]MDG1804678.1 SRPBCC family protein [Flavicella sp.]MDG2281355.1 SRPBCC family protein [Flavicella sp.]